MVEESRLVSENFGDSYAEHYDLMYEGKDYSAECSALETVFSRYSSRPVRRLADLGCGTGNHSVIWAERGFEVVGVDRSEPMVRIAREKATESGNASFLTGDLKDVVIGADFDAAVMMFAVLGYQVEMDDLLGVLRNTRAHLAPGGLFAADVWFGPAVLSQRPESRFRALDTAAGSLLKASTGRIDAMRQTCAVSMDLWLISDDRLVSHTQEAHEVRYFFPRELDLLMRVSGFELLDLLAFPDVGSDADETSWSALIVARAA